MTAYKINIPQVFRFARYELHRNIAEVLKCFAFASKSVNSHVIKSQAQTIEVVGSLRIGKSDAQIVSLCIIFHSQTIGGNLQLLKSPSLQQHTTTQSSFIKSSVGSYITSDRYP